MYVAVQCHAWPSLTATVAAGQSHARFAGKLSVVSAAAQEKAKRLEDKSAQELASRQPVLDQLNKDLADSHKGMAELKGSMVAAQDALVASRQQVASLREELASRDADHRAAQVHCARPSHSICAVYQLL